MDDEYAPIRILALPLKGREASVRLARHASLVTRLHSSLLFTLHLQIMTDHSSNRIFPYFTQEHEMLRDAAALHSRARCTAWRCLGGARLRAARSDARDGRARSARHALRPRIRRRGSGYARQRGT